MSSNEDNTVNCSVYISCYSSPIVWSWMVQLGDARKNSVTSFLNQAAETVLRFENLGIVMGVDEFEIDKDLFANPFEDPRLRSIKQNYRIIVMRNYYPLLYAFLSDVPRADRGKIIIPLIETYLVSFWGQAIGKTHRKSAVVSDRNYKKIATEMAEKLPKEPVSTQPEEKADVQDTPKATTPKSTEVPKIDSDSSTAEGLLGGSADGSNLDDWS